MSSGLLSVYPIGRLLGTDVTEDAGDGLSDSAVEALSGSGMDGDMARDGGWKIHID
jgi:hypothetical protein